MTIHQFVRRYPLSEITEGIDVSIVVGRLGSCVVAMLVNLIARPTASRNILLPITKRSWEKSVGISFSAHVESIEAGLLDQPRRQRIVRKWAD